MNILISTHIFPTELGKYKRIIRDLNSTYLHIDPRKHNIIFQSTLNLNDLIIKWSGSRITKEETISTFREINKLLMIPEKKCKVETNINFLGVNEHRRTSIKNYTNVDSIIYLDADLYFSENILKNHICAYDKIKTQSKYFIITPQVVKLWDNTWDSIVNKEYLNKDFDFYQKINSKEIVNKNHGLVSVEKIDKFKWGGGWFNSISPQLLTKVGIPNSFVGYGPDDTFVMACSSLLRNYGENIQQYVLKNELVAESNSTDNSDKFSEIPTNDMRRTLRYSAESNFISEIQKFRAKL